MSRGSGLVVRRGSTIAEVLRVAAETSAGAIHVSEDVSAFAQARQRRLSLAARERGIAVRTFPGVTVVPPGDLSPGGSGGPYRVFTPYWNRWRVAPWRTVLDGAGLDPFACAVDEGRLPGDGGGDVGDDGPEPSARR